MNSTVTAALSGTLFGAGLGVSQMTNPAKVAGFLDITGEWDPTLAFVMGGALLVSMVANQVARRRRAMQSPEATPPAESGVDRRLVLGSALFGIGWGLAGFCPGPALAALVTGAADVVLFVVSMIAGMALFRFTAATTSQAAAPRTERVTQ